MWALRPLNRAPGSEATREGGRSGGINWPTILAPLIMLPLAVPFFHRFFVDPLPGEERQLLKDRWAKPGYRWRTLQVAGIALLLALFNSRTVAGVPAWAALIAWAVTWPLVFFALGRWSRRLLSSDR